MALATGTNYSRRGAGEASYVQDHHFALYFDNNLVAEYLNPAAPDPETSKVSVVR